MRILHVGHLNICTSLDLYLSCPASHNSHCLWRNGSPKVYTVLSLCLDYLDFCLLHVFLVDKIKTK